MQTHEIKMHCKRAYPRPGLWSRSRKEPHIFDPLGSETLEKKKIETGAAKLYASAKFFSGKK